MALSLLYGNAAKYCTLLDEHMNESIQGAKKYEQLELMADPDRARVSTTVHQAGPRQQMHLVYPSEIKDAEKEEVVMTVQGFLVEARLPPILSRTQLASAPERTQQTITLTGIGSAHFAQAVLAVRQIHSVFDEYCPADELLNWTPKVVGGYPVLTASNRYFSSDQDSVNQDVLDLPRDLDPLNVLRGAVPSGVYSLDNQVLYYDRRKIANTNSWKHVTVQPTAFKIGQLVEAQVSFAVVPRGKHKYLQILKLRSLCILDRVVENELNVSAIEKLSASSGSKLFRMKRRVGYGDEGVEGAEGYEGDESMPSGLKKLRLDQDDKMSEEDK